MVTLQAQLSKLTMLIKQSPFRLLSDDEVSSGTRLTQGEFEARATAFVKDAESGIPGDETSIALTKALLAKMHRSRLADAVANAYMAPLFVIDPSLRPKAKGRRAPSQSGKKSK
jgi:hypothetical protein